MSKSFTITRKNGDKFEVVVDDWRYDEVMRHKWYVIVDQKTKRPYVVRDLPKDERNGKSKMHFLHWSIVGCPERGMVVDHKDRDTLNNCATNLRICTFAQNKRNQGATRRNPVGIKGITWRKDIQKWEAGIKANQKRHYLGCFDSIEAAKSAYNQAARFLHGEFAVINP